jgi:outer membrane autotransporter protein
MKAWSSTAAGVIAIGVNVAGPAPAQAAVVTLANGAVVNYQQTNLAQGGTGIVSGTLQQGAATSSFNCSYDAVRGQLTGSAACNQILGGAATGGLSLAGLEKQVVNARVKVASSLQADTNIRLLDDLIQRRVGAAFTAEVQDGAVGATAAPPSGLGSWAFAGGSLIDDNRLGLEKSGRDLALTAGLNHRSDTALIGGYIGYLNSDIDLKSLDGNASSGGYVLGAYATYLLGPVFSVTASGAYADSSVDLRRAFSGSTVTAAYGHSEWSGSITGNANWRLSDSLRFTAISGLTYGSWTDDAYTDSRGLAFDQAGGDNTWFKASGVLTLQPDAALRPYATATYSRLLSPLQFASGRDALSVGGGLALVSGRMSGGVEVSTLLLQPGQSATSIGLNFQLAF